MLQTPAFLVASPQMLDPFFSRTVVLIWTHSEEGTMGVVINRPLGLIVDTVLDQLDIEHKESFDQPVLWGGPVMPETGFLVCRGNVDEDEKVLAFHVQEDIWVSSSRTLLEKVARGDLPQPFYLCLGYAGWGPRQLDDEIERGSWIVLDFDEDILFKSPLEDRWDACIRSLGIGVDQIWMNNPIDE